MKRKNLSELYNILILQLMWFFQEYIFRTSYFVLLEQKKMGGSGVTAIWISPIKALTREIAASAEEGIADLEMNATVGLRTGDSTASQRAKQKKNPPHILITTPESLHLLLAAKGYKSFFSSLRTIVVDEWHELLGTKRGVQVELALSRLKNIQPQLRIWGISATGLIIAYCKF